MKIGVFYPTDLPFSARNYIENVSLNLKQLGADITFFKETESLPEVDLFWDPRSMGGVSPYAKLFLAKSPVIATVHGAAPLALPAWEYYPNLKNALIGKLYNLKKVYEWRSFRKRCSAIITVSSYAKWEIQKYLGLDGGKKYPIYHGVDLSTFKPATSKIPARPYFLHVSQYQPKKNVDRIIEAHARLPEKNRPQLIAIVPGYHTRKPVPKGVKLARTAIDHQGLVPLYQRGMAFVFPSLHETFGMPILEAMACGCPVITSNVTACPEIAGDAALLVNPRSVDEIAEAMKRLMEDERLRQELRGHGLNRARQFTWRRSAEGHLKVFEKVLKEAKQL